MTAVLPELGGLPAGFVLDGELVAWSGSQPYFPHICRRVLSRDMSVPQRSTSSLLAFVVASLTVVFLALPATVRADIVDLLTFQSAVDAAQAVDPTLNAPPNDGKHDFTVGGFERSNTPTNGGHTGFSAHSGPNGENARGHVSSTFDSSPGSPTPGVKERYDVVCLAVSGSDAAMGLVPTNSPKTNAGTLSVLAVHDGGLPGGAGDLYAFYYGADPTDCATYVLGAVFEPLHGNILVHDEP